MSNSKRDNIKNLEREIDRTFNSQEIAMITDQEYETVDSLRKDFIRLKKVGNDEKAIRVADELFNTLKEFENWPSDE